MAILPGTRLGPYEILSSIGAGGMGEVYRARDTRLNRIVAIKILPEHAADHDGLRERFEREACAISALNHPHICTLYDVGHQNGTDYLVMEYLEGDTLAQQLKKGPLPLDQVLCYAVEIADALDKAHRKGITHRDLKPGNIMLTKSGAKLLDFGLAKLKQEAESALPLSQLTTRDPITEQGVILGTLQYMAPEQVEGKEADARTDIFAFGAVVYEMVTGKKAFDGKSRASLIAKILETDPPPISSLQPMMPPTLDRVIKRCLTKDPDKRWQTASDLCQELKWIAEGSQASAPASVAASRKGHLSNPRLAWSVATVLLAAALGLGAFAYFERTPKQTRSVRFLVSPPEGQGFSRQLGQTGGPPAPLAVSPDGHQIAVVAMNADGKSLLWVRSLDTLAMQPLAGTEGAMRPFWSPDSRFLGFLADGKLKKIEVAGGPPITLCDVPAGGGSGTWGDGVIVFSPTPLSALLKVSDSGGVPTQLTRLYQGERAHLRPTFLPDGRHFLYRSEVSTGARGPIYVASLDSVDRKFVLNADATNVVYSQGYLLFLREKTLMAQPFDLRRLALSGDAFPIAEQIQTQGAGLPLGVFSASENGVLAYQTGAEAARSGSALAWFDRTGRQISTVGDPTVYIRDLELSPDGRRASVSLVRAGTSDIWVYDLERGFPTRFTFGPGAAITSIWSHDSSHIVFNSDGKGRLDLYQKASNGAGIDELLLADNSDKVPLSWSADGRFILFAVLNQSGSKLFILPLFGDRKPFPLLKTRFNEASGQFSPDGRWVAYTSDGSGPNEIYVVPFPGPGGKWQVSTAGGNFPRWRHDGAEIFYLAPNNELMAATVNLKGGSFERGAVKPLFQAPPNNVRYSYAVSADDKRFLIDTVPRQASSSSTPITVVVNWTAGLKQ